MSLERSIERIAEASEVMSRNNGFGHAAVQEIIRERDQATKELADMKKARDYWIFHHSDQCSKNFKLERRNAALRGVITRMKGRRENR